MRAVLILAALAAPAPADAEEAARALIARHGCGTCHVIPGVPGADGRTGPPLDAMARQVYVAGVIPNTLEGLARFIADPQEVDPLSAMPDLGLSPEEARRLAVYLHAAGER
ncbi:c-type cytochrome [Jannaschia formosa]|uniref:c-type cytochrome n=1 Tax=Jannaschia formosa TaxID=2259592 RepID=UPI000E1B7828|nr:cytochrome c1 protein [Jannaschia formosa]TFL18359.1 cytochrome c1 protein [Jannaschia formosa]